MGQVCIGVRNYAACLLGANFLQLSSGMSVPAYYGECDRNEILTGRTYNRDTYQLGRASDTIFKHLPRRIELDKHRPSLLQLLQLRLINLFGDSVHVDAARRRCNGLP